MVVLYDGHSVGFQRGVATKSHPKSACPLQRRLARRSVVTATAAQLPQRDAETEYCGDHHDGPGAAADDREGEPWVGVFYPATHLE
jgi:hypothetical protein